MANGSGGSPSTLNLKLELQSNLSPSNSKTISSPMTDLANNLEETCMVDTPRRRISWSSTGSTSPCRPKLLSIQDDGFYDSPPCDSPSVFAERFPPNFSQDQKKTMAHRPRSLLQRLHSVPSPKLRFSLEQEHTLQSESSHSWHSPTKNYEDIFPEGDGNSLDSGFDKEEMVGTNHSKLDFKFTEPIGIAPRRLRTLYEISPVKSESSRLPLSPISLVTVRPSSSNQSRASDLLGKRTMSASDGDDDGFLEEMDVYRQDNDNALPFGLSQLITGKIPSPNMSSPQANQSRNSFNNENHVDTPKLIPGKSCIRGLFGGKRSAGENNQKNLKRSDVSREILSPIHNKRRKSMSFCCRQIENRLPTDDFKPVPKPQILQRCHSETEATIMRAVQRSVQEPNLIGDFTRPYVLPLMQGKHQDLNCVSHRTIEKLMSGVYESEVEKFLIVDCRYPYEFDGGHIKGALNIYSKEGIMQEFLANPLKTTENNKRLVIVFHCEFSSERGPNLSRFLRNKDREVNKECYPQLFYPEIYLLDGGYKLFFENHGHMCEPQAYMPMLHKDHQRDMVHFRTKSKSWNGDKPGRMGSRLGMKL